MDEAWRVSRLAATFLQYENNLKMMKIAAKVMNMPTKSIAVGPWMEMIAKLVFLLLSSLISFADWLVSPDLDPHIFLRWLPKPD